MEQRDRTRLMDMWLSLHTPSPYEFYVYGAYAWGNQPSGYYGAFQAGFAAYATIFGVELQREFSADPARYLALFHFRIFGPRAQGMNITLQGGAKYEDRPAGQLWNPTVGFSMTIYLTRFFGIEGLFRHYLAADGAGGRFAGNRVEGGGFIDYKFVRVYGGYFQELDRQVGGSDRFFDGGFAGLKVFF